MYRNEYALSCVRPGIPSFEQFHKSVGYLKSTGVHLVQKMPGLGKLDGNVRTFTLSAVKWGLYVILVIAIISILGVPMASVITVLGTAGAAIALSLQGSLANLAGGIMLAIFKPFKVGDYIESSGSAGVVKEINLFYTVLNTLDNCRVTIPNGNLMAGNITNDLVGKLGMKSLQKGVRVEVTEQHVTVDLALYIKYNYNIPEVSAKVQDRVMSAIENMTGLKVLEVNIRIAGVNID